LTFPIITRFWRQPHAALFALLALHSMWRPYPEVFVLSPFVSHCLISSPGFPHSSNVHRAAAVVAGNRRHPSLIHHIRRLRFRLRADWRHVAGVGGHRRRQCKFRVWGQVRFHEFLSCLRLVTLFSSLPAVPCLWRIRKRPFLIAVQCSAARHACRRHTLLQTLLAHRRWLRSNKSKAADKKEHTD
jgi:hypothetical protein